MNDLIYIDIKHQVFWLSYEYLRMYNISENSFMNWSKRDVCKRKYIDGRAYINYDTIPVPSRSKLPNKEGMKVEYNRLHHSVMEERYYGYLQEATKSFRVGYWRNQILSRYPELNIEKLLEFAIRASVFEEVLRIDNTIRSRSKDHSALFYAFNRIYPNKGYTHRSRFCMAMEKARNEGILSVAVDTRALRKFEPRYKEDYQGLALALLSDPRAFDVTDCYDMFVEGCQYMKVEKTPSWDWFRLFWRKNKNIILPERDGKTMHEKEAANYAKIILALYSGDQWQMDGWDIPVYCKKRNEKGGWEYFVRYVLFVVMDAHSRKIIGFDVAESENTETILTSLDMAVRNTKTLPKELVADNHSWNKTKEAANLKEIAEKLGMIWTIDSNPRRKAILERTFRTLGDKHFKRYYGYLGQGIKSKIKNGITQQELKDFYSQPKNMPTFDQLCAQVWCIIQDYNDKVKKNLGESPNARYAKSEQPNSIQVDDPTRLKMFIRVSEHKISHGQIVIKRGMHTYEYQLPAKYSVEYNGKTVGVRYADFDLIYLYDIETDKCFCSVYRKLEIHGAIANQTETDTENLFKNSGRIKGINSQKRKKKESIYNEGNTINPNFIATANKQKTPKDVLKQVEHDNDLRSFMADKNINPETISDFPEVKSIYIDIPKKKEEKSPFWVENNEIRTITIEELAKAGNFHQSK